MAVRYIASLVNAAPPGSRFRGLLPYQVLRYRRPVLWQELVLVGIGYYLYREARNLVPDQPGIAFRHGQSVQWLQEHLHLNFELSINRFVSGISWLAQVMNYYYSTLHFVVTIGVLTWLFVARKRVYRGMRTALFALTLVALVGFFFYPAGAAEIAARVRLHRHVGAVPHLGFTGRPEHRRAHQPVRRHAQPAYRMGVVVRDRGGLLHAQVVGPHASGDLPRGHPARHRGHGQPLHHRRRRRGSRGGHRLRNPIPAVWPTSSCPGCPPLRSETPATRNSSSRRTPARPPAGPGERPVGSRR